MFIYEIQISEMCRSFRDKRKEGKSRTDLRNLGSDRSVVGKSSKCRKSAVREDCHPPVARRGGSKRSPILHAGLATIKSPKRRMPTERTNPRSMVRNRRPRAGSPITPTITTGHATLSHMRDPALRSPGRTPPARPNGDGQPLHDAALIRALAGQHAVVDGEVAADHVGLAGGGVLGQLGRRVLVVARGVLAVVDAGGGAVEAIARCLGFEDGFGPFAAVAETWWVV